MSKKDSTPVAKKEGPEKSKTGDITAVDNSAREPLIHVTFIWRYGAMEDVFISGSFNLWANKIPLKPLPSLGDAEGPTNEDIQFSGFSDDQLKQINQAVAEYKAELLRFQQSKNAAQKKPRPRWIRRWVITLTLPAGQHYFKYIVDGQWRHDHLFQFGPDQNGNIVNMLVLSPTATTGEVEDHEALQNQDQANLIYSKDGTQISAQYTSQQSPVEVGSQNAAYTATSTGQPMPQSSNPPPSSVKQPNQKDDKHDGHDTQHSDGDSHKVKRVDSKSSNESVSVSEEIEHNSEPPTKNDDGSGSKSISETHSGQLSEAQGDYTQHIPSVSRYRRSQPLPLPALLGAVLLDHEQKRDRGEEACLLPFPDHVSINHIYLSTQSNNTQSGILQDVAHRQPASTLPFAVKASPDAALIPASLMAITQRYRHKASTIVFVTPPLRTTEAERRTTGLAKQILRVMSERTAKVSTQQPGNSAGKDLKVADDDSESPIEDD